VAESTGLNASTGRRNPLQSGDHSGTTRELVEELYKLRGHEVSVVSMDNLRCLSSYGLRGEPRYVPFIFLPVGSDG